MKMLSLIIFFEKKLGVRKFCPDLETLEAFFCDLSRSLVLGDFASLSLDFFKSWSHGLNQGSHSLAKSQVPFYTPRWESALLHKRIEFHS